MSKNNLTDLPTSPINVPRSRNSFGISTGTKRSQRFRDKKVMHALHERPLLKIIVKEKVLTPSIFLLTVFFEFDNKISDSYSNIIFLFVLCASVSPYLALGR
jgi:hypothetical protein